VSPDIRVIHCHAEGEVGDVIVSGVDAPPGDTIWAQSRFIAHDKHLREYVLNEPRGGVFRHINLIVPAVDPRAAFGFIIMEPEDTPPMSGSNAMCVATVALETGIVQMAEPRTRFIMEAPAGLVEVTAECTDGKAVSITVENVPSFVCHQQVPLELSGYPALHVDIAFGGDSFVIADAATLGFSLQPDEARDLVGVGIALRTAANEQWGFHHPELPDWRHISFAFITGELEKIPGGWSSRNTCVINPGKLDRSPTGTGCSAWMAVLHKRGILGVHDRYVGRSIIDSSFVGNIVRTTNVGDIPAIVPTIQGRGWRYGESTWNLDPSDPWPRGYRLTDTWPDVR
jgi:trans-L-3-hydroxyproline dehydratase